MLKPFGADAHVVVVTEVVKSAMAVTFAKGDLVRANDVRPTGPPFARARTCIYEYDFSVHLGLVREAFRYRSRVEGV